MEASTETAVRREISIAASPETVWDFFVDPGEGDALDGQSGAPSTRGRVASTAWR